MDFAGTDKEPRRKFVRPLDTLRRERAIRMVGEERIRQDEIWGEQNHPPEVWLAILVEEVGELGEAILKQRYPQAHDPMFQKPSSLARRVLAPLMRRLFNVEIGEGQPEIKWNYVDLREETTQIAAVAVAFMEYLERMESRPVTDPYFESLQKHVLELDE